MSWAMVAGAAITVVGGYVSKKQSDKGAKNAANAQAAGQMASIEEQRRQFDLTREDQKPWMETGQWALDGQKKFMEGDWSGFQNSPDYAYSRDQMVQGLDRSAASRGRLYSGGYGVDMAGHLNGLASQNANNYWNRLAGLSGTGQNTAANLGNLGMGMANNIGNAYANIGNARASSYQQIGQNNADFWAGTANQLGGLAGQYYGQRRNPNGGWQ